jgi:hypothetical protein
MTSTARQTLIRNAHTHIRSLQAAIDRLTELRAHHKLTAISRALAKMALSAEAPIASQQKIRKSVAGKGGKQPTAFFKT